MSSYYVQQLMDTLGGHIRDLRARQGMSRMDLAVSVGVDVQSIGRWERSERTPNQYHLLSLAAALDVEPAALGYQAPTPVGSQAPMWAQSQHEELLMQIEQLRRELQEVRETAEACCDDPDPEANRATA